MSLVVRVSVQSCQRQPLQLDQRRAVPDISHETYLDNRDGGPPLKKEQETI